MRPLAFFIALGLGLWFLSCGDLSEDAAAQKPARPNVLLITLDSVRADVIGAYGHRPRFTDRSPSPRLDRLAEEGLLVEQAYATSSWTLPSHVSILTGLPEVVHGVEQNGHKIHETLPLVSVALKERGYRTAGVYSGPYLDPSFGFGLGFDTYEDGYGVDLRAALENLHRSEEKLDKTSSQEKRGQLYTVLSGHDNAHRALEVASHRDRSSKRVADTLIAQLEKHEEGPFFLFGHFFDPHYDYAPPEEFAQAFDPDYKGDLDGNDFIHNPAIATLHSSGRTRIVDDRGLQHLWALYEAEVAWTDAQIGRVLDRLEELGLAQNTLVIVTSDHGDEFFEHNSIGHRSTLYEELVHVPLIVRYPADFAPGSRIERPVSLIEVTPTILRAAHIPLGNRIGVGLQAIINGLEPGPVLGRIVLSDAVPLTVANKEIPGARTRILETFRQGSIKIFREIAWIQPTEVLSDKLAPVVRDLKLDMLANETITWVKLEEDPDEKRLRQTMRNPKGKRVLESFQDAYRQLLLLHHSPGRVEVTENLLTALSGLGYVEQEARLGALEGDELVLYPPGRPEGELKDRQLRLRSR